MSCLNNIVTLGLCPDNSHSESGLTLLQAPGISIKGLANITNDTKVSGVDLALKQKELSLIQVQNDLIASLNANRAIVSMSESNIQSASIITGQSSGLYNGFRGQVINKVHRKGSLTEMTIERIELFPLTSGTVSLKIDDGINIYNLSVPLTGGQTNIIDSDLTDLLPMVISHSSSKVKVTIDQSNVMFAKSLISCMKGCNGTAPNECGYVDGWNGSSVVKSEGYGMNVVFKCRCKYEDILCNMNKQLIGEIIWLKWQINIFKEQLRSNRFNNWVVYAAANITEQILPELTQEYNEKWQAIMNGLPDILKRYNDSCISCRGSRWEVRI